MLLPLLSAVFVTLARTNGGALRASLEDSLRCAPGERRIQITGTEDPRSRFSSNEHLEYSASYRKVIEKSVGTGEMRLVGRDTVRGRVVWKSMFIIDGGLVGVRFHDTTVSWFDSVTFNSVRFMQHLHDPGYSANRDTQIFPEERKYRTNDGEAHASVSDPLDDMSFVYLVRRLPLEPGQCYVLSRYFKPESNPVVVHVIRRDTVSVPAGRFPAILIRPEIKTKGMFSQNGHAELWLADDSARTVLQLKTNLPIGSINLRLRRISHDP
jgi:Protein of unknown function (DUF3108)